MDVASLDSRAATPAKADVLSGTVEYLCHSPAFGENERFGRRTQSRELILSARIVAKVRFPLPLGKVVGILRESTTDPGTAEKGTSVGTVFVDHVEPVAES